MGNIQTNAFFDVELEEIVLGALLLEQGAILDVIDIINPNMFYSKECKAVYTAILELHDANDTIDTITVSELLSKTKENEKVTESQLYKIGGYSYLVSLTGKVASSGHIQRHAMIISDLYDARQIHTILTNHLRMLVNVEYKSVHDVSLSASEHLDQLNAIVMRNGMLRISDTISEAQQSIYKRTNAYRNNEFVGVSTGLIGLDRITGGWQGKQFIVIAGRPAMGKTAFLLHLATSASISNAHVCIYSLEMGTTSLLDRMIHRNTQIDEFAYKKGSMTDKELQEVEQSIATLEKLDIYIDDKSSCTLRYIRTNAKMLHKQGKCDIIFIDYLQIMDTIEAGRNREQEVSTIARGLKKLAKDLDIPVIALAQLGRGVESRSDKMPILSDLRESGAIEQEADIVAFLYRPAVYGIDTITYGSEVIDTDGYGEFIVAKHRDGAIGAVKFNHNRSLTKITDYNANFNSNQSFKQIDIPAF